MRFQHNPVMVDEVVALLAPAPPGVFIDATLGGAGHATFLLNAAPHLSLVGIDRDADAVAAASARLAPFGDRVVAVHHRRFDALGDVARGHEVSAVLFDLGVSSPQLDVADRGFSYRADAPLDMRMDRSAAKTAADVVNGWDEQGLARLFADNGEARFARRTGGHPAKRVFQAIRIEVNDELELLAPALDAAIDALVPGGRCAVLAYHSGEDRIVKERFRQAATGGCTCPPHLPCGCGATPTVRLLTRGARKPTAAEVAANPRAESARLRAVEKLGAAHRLSPAAPAAL